MIRIHKSNYVPRYLAGKWLWNNEEEKIEFESNVDPRVVKEEFLVSGGYKFKTSINQLEEIIFRQEFQRSDATHDADVILLQDIKNLVLFLSPADILKKKFIHFIHLKTVDRFLRALIIYFEHYLKIIEFLFIRRDETTGHVAKLQSEESTEVKRVFSCHLTQYRLLLAREYSLVLLGAGEMKGFYHIKPIVNISQTIRDRCFHETLLAFATQVVWVAMHRRGYDVIDAEMGRLFRSEHFLLNHYERLQFSAVESGMMYGKNYKRVNYRAQNSPLIQELASVSKENLPVLWIGERKYRGTDLRMHELELEYIVPSSQLCLIDVSHGILGHPKKLYNTMLILNWEAVRAQKYSDVYDPYHIFRQPVLRLPKMHQEKMRKFAEKYEPYYELVTHYEAEPETMLEKWRHRNEILEYFRSGGVTENIWMKCVLEVKSTDYGPSVKEIIQNFLARKEKLRKN